MHNYLNCSKCRESQPIPETGLIRLQIDSHKQRDIIKEKLHKLNPKVHSNHLELNYDSLNKLNNMINEVNNLLYEPEKKQVEISWLCGDNKHMPYIPLSQFSMRVIHPNYLKIINERLYKNFVQPIVSLDSFNVYGYEFLLRPINKEFLFQPGKLFQFSQDAGLQSLLDSQARIAAIKNSAEMIPQGIKRFINFLPSSIYNPHYCLQSTFKAAEEAEIDPKDLVFEVVETEKIKDIDHLKSIFDVYKQHGIKVALDDLGAGFSTLQVLKELQPSFVKIDRKLVDHCDEDKQKQAKLLEIISLANDYEVTVLAEGIERKEEAQFCKSIGIPLAQGYYFAKPQKNTIHTDSFTHLK